MARRALLPWSAASGDRRMGREQGLVPESYQALLGALKERIRSAQVRAALSVNRELILLYWQIGGDIIARQQEHGWGAQVIDRLTADLRVAFPHLKGFSRRNLQYMRAFAETYPDERFVQQVVAQIPWGHKQDFYLDLLFYHLHLRCYVVIDLKVSDFQPEYAGKMNFYLSAADDLLRHPDDQPSIGLILCKSKNKVVAEYALRDVNKPIGVSAYHLTEALPERLQASLPTIEELEATLSDVDTE